MDRTMTMFLIELLMTLRAMGSKQNAYNCGNANVSKAPPFFSLTSEEFH